MTVEPIDAVVAATVLAVGLFIPKQRTDGKGGPPIYWSRDIPEEDCSVEATIGEDKLELGISPGISADDHHKGKRITAGVYFEIAAKYAEHVEGRIVQMSNIGECRANGTSHVIAEYPGKPMDWAKICPGFQRELLAMPEGE